MGKVLILLTILVIFLATVWLSTYMKSVSEHKRIYNYICISAPKVYGEKTIVTYNGKEQYSHVWPAGEYWIEPKRNSGGWMTAHLFTIEKANPQVEVWSSSPCCGYSVFAEIPGIPNYTYNTNTNYTASSSTLKIIHDVDRRVSLDD